MPPVSPYTVASLSRMLDLVRGVSTPDAPGLIDAPALATCLDDLFDSLGMRIADGDEDARLFAELAGADELTPAQHRDLSARYAAVAEAPDPLAPGLIDKDMRRALNRLGRHGNRRLRQFGRESAANGTISEEPPLLDRLEADLNVLRDAASRLAHYHGSLGPHKGRPHDNRLDTVLVTLADLFIELVGYQGGPGQMTTETQRAFLSFAESALEPYSDILGGTARESLKKRWARLTKQHLSYCS